jgi:AbrB family looped-hinge helix DNA binding protein
MPRVKIGARHQVTLPVETLKRLGLDAGEELEVVEHDKMILLVPCKHIPKDQEWYYTEAWQRMMQEAFDDLKAGRMLGPFETVEELITELNT